MPLGPLGVTALLALLDWGAWEWAISTNHPTIGLIAGLFMAPIVVGFAWSLARVTVVLAQMGLRRAIAAARPPRQPHADAAARAAARAREREQARAAAAPVPAPRAAAHAPAHAHSAPFDIQSENERVAA